MSTVFEFGALIHNPLLLHPWMVEQHLLPEHVDCPECGATMKPGIGTTTLCCSKRSLHANNKAVKVSWLKGTFFEGSCDKKTVFHCFSLRLTYDETMRNCLCARAMVAKWYAYCREVCVEALRLDGEHAAEKIGGEGKTVEIDESKIGKSFLFKCTHSSFVYSNFLYKMGQDFFDI